MRVYCPSRIRPHPESPRLRYGTEMWTNCRAQKECRIEMFAILSSAANLQRGIVRCLRASMFCSAPRAPNGCRLRRIVCAKKSRKSNTSKYRQSRMRHYSRSSRIICSHLHISAQSPAKSNGLVDQCLFRCLQSD